MAEIVLLNKWRSKRPAKPQISIGETERAGQVLMFTGVRYERYDAPEVRVDRKAENHAV